MKTDHLPASTRKLLDSIGPNAIDNHYLVLQRYFDYNDRETSRTVLQHKCSVDLNKKDQEIIKFINGKQDKILCTLEDSLRFLVKQTSRWAIGIGGPSPYGNLLILALHPLYGIPYIPASTLKGLIRCGWAEKIHDGTEDEIRLFGSQSDSHTFESENSRHQGGLIFFDSFPQLGPGKLGPEKLVMDVFTPHYQAYYSGLGIEGNPTDDQNPVPIYFLSLEDYKFDIHIGSQSHLSSGDRENIAKSIEYAFSDLGIGAKTSTGYGYGTVNTNV